MAYRLIGFNREFRLFIYIQDKLYLILVEQIIMSANIEDKPFDELERASPPDPYED